MAELYVYVAVLSVGPETPVSFWHITVSASDEHQAYSEGYKAFSKCSNRELGLAVNTKSQILNDYVIPVKSLGGDK